LCQLSVAFSKYFKGPTFSIGKEQAINAQIRKLIAESGIIADLQIGGRGRRTRPLRTR